MFNPINLHLKDKIQAQEESLGKITEKDVSLNPRFAEYLVSQSDF